MGTEISLAASLLRQGQLVAIPTETVYGLAANALDEQAVARIFAAKNRPTFNPLIVHGHSAAQLFAFAADIPPAAQELVQAFWPGPLTLLLPKKDIPDIVTAGNERVALRVPSHPLSLALLQQLDFPLAAPSANPFGYVSPTTAQHVADQLGENVAFILDGGPCTVGIESTIIGWEGASPLCYRQGGISIDEIEKITGPLAIKAHSDSNPQAPGMLSSHYSPGKRILLGDIPELMTKHPEADVILSFSEQYRPNPKDIVLAPDGSTETAARHLFSALRLLDDASIQLILAEPAPETGLGPAINDRLRRAAIQ